MRSLFKKLSILCLTAALMLSFGLLNAPRAAAATDISKILTTISATPVALTDPSKITVATSTPGCHIKGAYWYDASGKPVSGAFGTETYRLEIWVTADDGYTINSDCKCYLNNSSISSAIRDAGKTAVLIREYTAAIWAPTVYKNPTAETVDEGGWASFVVSAAYTRDYQWGLQDPSGNSFIELDSVKGFFQGVETTGNGSSKIMIYHIPAEMNGWKVVCNFIGAGVGNVVPSQPALITVRGAAGRAAAQPQPQQLTAITLTEDGSTLQADTVTNEDSQSGGLLNSALSDAAESSGLLSDADAASASGSEPAAHVHVYSQTWSYDARGHWHECPDDGARADEELHNMTWTVINQETGEESGRCSVCGYTTVRRPAAPSADTKAEKSSLSLPPSALMWGLCALLPIDIVCAAVHGSIAGRKDEDDFDYDD
ncbi:MAG: hypothetical protein IKS55_06730 [Oscillospiraceae bacterium]|nr:hypothetical protein [Oscillospiraceae bacterium]